MAAEPVSPLVAPMTVKRSLFVPSFPLFRRNRKYSNKLPKNCNATSLKANVGPWNNSSKCKFLLPSTVMIGLISLALKVS